MNTLSLKSINSHAPYRVTQKTGLPYFYQFSNEYGVDFEVSIVPNSSIIPSGGYEIAINNRGHHRSPNDIKLRHTVLAIIEEFFDRNNDVMLYLAETGDGKQKFRNRLFLSWFNTYEYREKYMIRSAEGKMEGQENFMALISRVDNPNLALVIQEFEETISLLFD